MPDTTYYRSAHPAVSEFTAEFERRRDVFDGQLDALRADFPGYEIVKRVSHGHHYVIGLKGERCPGVEWLKKSDEWFWSPSKRRAAGKRLAERLRGIELKWPPLPGMPQIVVHDLTIWQPGQETLGGVFWVIWGTPAEEVERCPSFDPAIWTRARASEYWLAKETEERQGEG